MNTISGDAGFFAQTESSFVLALKEGREDAMERLYNDYSESLFSYAARITKDTEESKDIVNEVFIKYLKKRADYSSIKQIKDFLFLNTRHLSLNFLRNQGNRNNIITDVFTPADGMERHILNGMIRSELTGYLLYYMRQLPEKQRKAITGLLLEGKSATEVAAELNISPKQLSSVKSRALQFLRKKILIQKAVTWLLPLYWAVDRVKS